MRASYAVGLDVGGSHIAAGLVERKGRVIRDVRRPTPQAGPFGVVDAIIEVIAEVTAGVHPSEITGIGLGLPAQIDFHRQTVEFCTNLPLGGVDMRGLIMSRVKHPVTIDNDGHTAALGEWRFGAAKGIRDFVMVTVGTGVGGGVFVAGMPFRGHRGLGGELGHVVVDIDGPPCPCGGTGHLESFVGAPAILRVGREAVTTFKGAALLKRVGGDVEGLTTESIIDAANAGDETASEIMGRVGFVLGKSLVGVVNLMNPQMIVVGGGIGESCPLLLERAAQVISDEALAGRRDVKVVPAELGNDAGVVGAGALAFDEHDSREGLQR